jgi:hypothetical protein
MITILGSLVGLIPTLFKYFQQWQDGRNQLAIMQIQLQMMQAGLNMQLQEVAMNAQVAQVTSAYNTIKTNIGWVDALNGLIRPLIAIIYTAKMIYAMIYPELIELADHDYGIYSCVISFYFGGLIRFK